MKLDLAGKLRRRQRLTTDSSRSLGASGDGSADRYVHSAAVDIDEVLFCILDSLVDGKAETGAAATNTVLRFARLQQDFTIRSILYFLEVQKTTEAHQHALLCLLRKCITQSHDTIPAGLMRDILLFILKELNFLSTSDLRHSVMVETLKETAVLCPAFSVEVILAFISGMRREGACLTETLCIYIRVLSHVFDKASHNDYIKGVGVIGQIIALYDATTLSVDSGELCKSMVSLLCILSKALYPLQSASRPSVAIREDCCTQLFDALSLENVAGACFSSWHERYRMFTPSVVKPPLVSYETMDVHQLGALVDGAVTPDPDVVWSPRSADDSIEVTTASRLVVRSHRLDGKTRAMSSGLDPDGPSLSDMGGGERGFVEVAAPVPSVEESSLFSTGVGSMQVSVRSVGGRSLQDVLDPLFSLLVDKSLSTMYINPHYNDTCLEVLCSLSLFSKHVSDSILSRYGLTVLDSIVVRFYHYLHGIPYRQLASQNHSNAWMILHRESSDSYRNKLVTIFSSIGSYVDRTSVLPPPSLVMCLLNVCKVLLVRHAHLVLCQMPNICEVLFGLLVGLHVSGKASLLTLCDSSLVAHSAEEDDLLLNQGVSGAFLNIHCTSACKDFVSTLVCACRFFVSSVSSRTYFLDFLFRKALSGNDKETAVALFMLGWSCSHPSLSDTLSRSKLHAYSRPDFRLNCGLFWRLIETLSTMVSNISLESANPCTLRLILTMINHLSRGNWLTFHCLVGYSRAANYHDDFYKDGSPLVITKAVHSLIDFVFNLKVSYDVEERIAKNTNYSSGVNSKLNSKFFRYMYCGKNSTTHDLGLLVSGSISFERFLLSYSGDVMFMYLVNNLLSNTKMGVLTVLRSVHRLFTWDSGSSLSTRCSDATFSRMLAFVLLYLHDPINYYGEAYAAAKLLPHVSGVLFGQKYELTKDVWLKKAYSGVDLYTLSYEPGDSYGHLSGMDHIVLHFEKISRLLHSMSGSQSFSKTALPVIEQLSKIAQHLKPPVTTYTSLLKLGNVQASSSITVYHCLGMLHILAAYGVCSADLCSVLVDFLLGFKGTPSTVAFDTKFTVDESLSHLVKSFGKWAALTLCIRDKVRYTMVQLRMLKIFNGETNTDKSIQDGRLFFNVSPDDILHQEIITLRGLAIALLGMSTTNYCCVLWKVYYSILTRLPSSGALFTKFSSSTFCDDVKSIALTAMGYLYACTPVDLMDERFLVGSSTPSSEIESHVSRQLELLATLNDESHLVGMYNCCFRVDHLTRISNDLSEDTGLLRCIVAPMVYLCFHESDPLVQLSIARAFMFALRSLKSRGVEALSLRFPLIALKRILYFVSNPAVKEFSGNQLYDTSALEQQYSHLFNSARWDLDFSQLKAVDIAPLKPVADGVTCSNISLSYFAATCLLSEFLSSDDNAFTTLHTVLSFGDYCRRHVKSHSSPREPWIESINLEDLTVHVMWNCFSNFGWQRLSHIISVALFISEDFPKELITYRVSLVVTFLGGVDFSRLPSRAADHDEHMGFVDCVLLLWAHMLRLESGSALRNSLRGYLEEVLRIGNGGMDDTAVIPSADLLISGEPERIDLLLPKESLMMSLLCCMKYLSASTCISGSFAVIMQMILQQRYSDLDHKHLESILATIFSNFSSAFEHHDVPCSLHNFVIDLAQTDFVVLCNVIFSQSSNYKKSFTLSVAKLITTDPSLMVQLLDFLESCLLSDYCQIPGTRYNASIDFILDFTESIYLSSDAQILLSDEGVRFMVTLALHFLYLSRTAVSVSVAVLRRFIPIVKRFISIAAVRNTGVPNSVTASPVTGGIFKKAKSSASGVSTNNVSQMVLEVVSLCHSLITSSESYKLCFLRFVESIVNLQNDIKPLLLRLCLSVFCSLLKKGAFILYGGLVLCLIQKITLFKEFQKYYYKAIHYYLQRVELLPMGVYTRQLVAKAFRSSRVSDGEATTLKKPTSPVLSVDLSNLKRCILDRLVISLLDDLVSPLSTDVLYCIERAASSLIVYVSTRWGCKVRNFNVLISRLLRNYTTLMRNDPRILFAFSQLYLSIARWLEASIRHRIILPIEVQRHLLPPLGLLILHRSVSMRYEGTCRKLTRYLATIVGDTSCQISAPSSSRSWLKAVLLRRLLGPYVPRQLCICGCNNPHMSHMGDIRFCVCHGFYLLDLFSSCFPSSCWNIELGTGDSIEAEIARLKKDEHLKRTSQVLFGGASDNNRGMNSPIMDATPLRSMSGSVVSTDGEFFDLSTIYPLHVEEATSLVSSNGSPSTMLTARSMHTCSFGNSTVPLCEKMSARSNAEYKRALSADTVFVVKRATSEVESTASCDVSIPLQSGETVRRQPVVSRVSSTTSKTQPPVQSPEESNTALTTVTSDPNVVDGGEKADEKVAVTYRESPQPRKDDEQEDGSTNLRATGRDNTPSEVHAILRHSTSSSRFIGNIDRYDLTRGARISRLRTKTSDDGGVTYKKVGSGRSQNTASPVAVRHRSNRRLRLLRRNRRSMGKALNTLPCLPSLLPLLTIADFKFGRDGTVKRINVFNSERLNTIPSGESHLDARNVSFFDISSLDTVWNTTLYTSPAVYRFMLVRKYLTRQRLYPSIIDDREQTSDISSTEFNVPEEVMVNAVKGVVAILHMAIIHLSREGELLREHILAHWPTCFLEMARYNAILHFESLAMAATKQLCKMLETSSGRIKRVILESMELLAIVRSTSLTDEDEAD